MKITRIEISNFRSINDKIVFRGSDLNMLTLIGANSSGKSNILRAINLFFNNEVEEGKRFNPNTDLNQKSNSKRGRIFLELKFDSRKDKTITTFVNKIYKEDFKANLIPITLTTYSNGTLQYNVTTQKGQKKNSPDLIQRIKDYVNCVYIPAIKDYKAILNQQMLKKIVALTFQGWGKGRRGSKVIGEQKMKFKNLLSDIQKVLDESGNIASDIITQVVPGIDKFSFSLPYDNLEEFLGTVLFEISEKHLAGNINLENVGSGVQSFTILTMLRLLHELRPSNTYKNKFFLWLIEEPETFLHHDMQRMTREKLREYSNEGIIFISSHSPVFVDKSNFNNSYLIFLNQMTKIKRIKAENILEVLAGHLGLDIQDFLPFKRYNILVEGDSDKEIILGMYKKFKEQDPTWKVDISELEILVCGSANAIPHFYNTYKIFAQYSDLFALFDRDQAGLRARENLLRKGYVADDLILIPESSYKTSNEIEDLVDKDLWDEILNELDSKGLVVLKTSKGKIIDYEFEHKNRVRVKKEFSKLLVEKSSGRLNKYKKVKILIELISNRMKNAT